MKDEAEHAVLDLEELEKMLDTLEVTTTEAVETTSQNTVKHNERDSLLATAASMLKQLDNIKVQLKTAQMDQESVRKVHERLKVIAERIPAMMTKVKELDVDDERQYSLMLMVCTSY